MANPFTFIQQVRSEATKVHWPNRRETLVTTLIVIAMAVVASLFLLAVDVALQNIVGFILGFGHSH